MFSLFWQSNLNTLSSYWLLWYVLVRLARCSFIIFVIRHSIKKRFFCVSSTQTDIISLPQFKDSFERSKILLPLKVL